MTTNSYSGFHSLPAGTCLHNTYLIQETIGAGGFAVTYKGVRKDTGKTIAIKEYFPPSLAVRNEQEGLYVLYPFPNKNTGMFQKGLRRFLNEAKILKSFQELESIVSVYDLFEENGTAYLVMEYIEGLTLSQYVAENGTLTFPEISELIAPVIHSLAKVHERGLIHRDISPDNLILGIDNKLHLIDFGAASFESNKSTQNTVIIKAGYAPPEQYIPNGKIGPWIDIYAICATIYFSLTGSAPTESVHPSDTDLSPALTDLNQLLPWQYAILEKGLQFRPSDRFQSVNALYSALTGTSENNQDITILQMNMPKKGRTRIHTLLPKRHNTLRPVLFSVLGIVILGMLVTALARTLTERTEVIRNYSIPTQPAISSPPAKRTATPKKPKIFVMPDVTGTTTKKAKKRIHNLDSTIRIDVSYTYNNTIKKGNVINQSVAGGVHFTKGQLPSISLTVSKGKKSSVTNSPKEKKPTKKSPDYKVKNDDDLISIPLD